MRVIKVNENKVVEVKMLEEGYTLSEGEIESDTGEVGQTMQEDGSFIDPEPESYVHVPTLGERVEKLQTDMDYLILKQEGLI